MSTVEEAKAAVDDYVAMKPLFVKIWVDDRGGTKKTLTPPLYRAVVEEAHKFNVPVGVHNVTLANAKELMRAGVEGWLHVPARGGEEADDELVSIVKSGDMQLVIAALNALAKAGEAALPVLRTAALSGAQNTRYAAVVAIGQLGSSKATQLLGEILSTGDRSWSGWQAYSRPRNARSCAGPWASPNTGMQWPRSPR